MGFYAATVFIEKNQELTDSELKDALDPKMNRIQEFGDDNTPYLQCLSSRNVEKTFVSSIDKVFVITGLDASEKFHPNRPIPFSKLMGYNRFLMVLSDSTSMSQVFCFGNNRRYYRFKFVVDGKYYFVSSETNDMGNLIPEEREAYFQNRSVSWKDIFKKDKHLIKTEERLANVKYMQGAHDLDIAMSFIPRYFDLLAQNNFVERLHSLHFNRTD